MTTLSGWYWVRHNRGGATEVAMFDAGRDQWFIAGDSDPLFPSVEALTVISGPLPLPRRKLIPGCPRIDATPLAVGDRVYFRSSVYCPGDHSGVVIQVFATRAAILADQSGCVRWAPLAEIEREG